MPHMPRRPNVWLVAVLATISSLMTSTASGHERREVGPYRFIVGFLVEPAFEGLKNGVDLRVFEAASEAPLEGLQDTLQVEITHVPSAVGKVLKLRTIYRDPGHYTADLIPTAPGQYRFRFFGNIQDMAVQETFDSKSGGDSLMTSSPPGTYSFPCGCQRSGRSPMSCGVCSRAPSRPTMLPSRPSSVGLPPGP